VTAQLSCLCWTAASVVACAHLSMTKVAIPLPVTVFQQQR